MVPFFAHTTQLKLCLTNLLLNTKCNVDNILTDNTDNIVKDIV